ncbi:MAG TPA: type II secretion system protein [Gemmatimonadales bacterium]|nr:type II secretion system protein [Gemmatimonadales bacterium]
MMRGRRGFTFIELLVVCAVIGILSGLAVLKYIDLRYRAMSAQVVGDLEAIRLAAYTGYYETGHWAPDAGPGLMPAQLVPYMSTSFSFSKPEYTLDWENFVPPGGGPSGGMQVGVVVDASNARLARSLRLHMGTRAPFFITGSTITYVLVGPDGRS